MSYREPFNLGHPILSLETLCRGDTFNGSPPPPSNQIPQDFVPDHRFSVKAQRTVSVPRCLETLRVKSIYYRFPSQASLSPDPDREGEAFPAKMSPTVVCGYLGASGSKPFWAAPVSKRLKIQPFNRTSCLLLLFLMGVITYISASITRFQRI